MYLAQGILKYLDDEKVGKKAIILIEQDLVKYYLKLIPKWFKVKEQKFDAHITVVRHEKHVKNFEEWGEYENEIIEFTYSNIINWDDKYYWMTVYCDRISEIRAGLDMTTYPDYHLTIGNTK